MKIIVCMKQVPATQKVDIDPETGNLKRSGQSARTNPYDLYALECALRIREQVGGTVTVLTMGPPQAEAMIRDAYSMGADEGVILSDRKFAGSDVLATSYTLAQGIRTLGGADLIICGRQTTDGDTAQVGPEIAEHLGLPQITYALDILEKDGEIQVKREYDAGYDMISTSLPAVVTVVKLPYEPRYPTIKSKMAAKKKEIPVLTEADIPAIDLALCGLNGSPTRVKKTYTPVQEKNGVKLTGMEAVDAAKEVVKLMEEAKLL